MKNFPQKDVKKKMALLLCNWATFKTVFCLIKVITVTKNVIMN